MIMIASSLVLSYSHTLCSLLLFRLSNIIHRSILTEPHVRWIDNYSSTHRKVNITLTKGAIDLCLWSVQTVQKVWVDNLNLDIRRNEQGDIIPALPPNLLDSRLVNTLKSQYVKVNNEHKDSIFSSALCYNWKVGTVPMKPSRELNDDYYKSCPADKSQKISSLLPFSIDALNPAADRGLFSIIGNLNVEISHMNKLQYVFVKADVNLFNRFLKVRSLIQTNRLIC